MENYISALEMGAGSDSARIQLAIEKAKAEGVDRVVIPRKTTPWVIDETICIPSDLEILIDGAHLIMADDTYAQMFATENFLKKEKVQQKNIRIHGINGALLDGGKYNGLCEKNSLKDGRPHISCNTMMMFYYTRDLHVHDLKIINQRYWGITNMFVEYATYRDIEFKADLSRVDENGVHHPNQFPRNYNEVYIKNADGVDLRVGCNHITVENISGFTEDDTVALTALGGFEKPYLPEGKDTDIHDVTIRNIASDCYICSNVRLLCGRGNKLYNIDIDGVRDISQNPLYQTNASVRIGDVLYGEPSKLGDMHHITVKNVVSRGTSAVSICRPICDSKFENIFNEKYLFVAVEIRHGAQIQNVLFENLKNCYGNQQ